MIERNNASSARRSDAIYNPIEEKWERRLTSRYLGDLEDFSLEKEFSVKMYDIKNKAISTRKTAEGLIKSESVKLHINDLKSSMKDSVQKLKELGEELTTQEENTAEIQMQSHIEDNDNDNENEIEEYEQDYEEEYDENFDPDSEDSEENQSLTLLKIVIAIIGLIVAFVSN